MIETLAAILPIIIYLLLIVLLVVVIVLGIKFIITVDKINSIITDVQEKIASVNSIFKIANLAVEKVNMFGSRLIDSVMMAINKILGFKSGKEDDDYE